MFKFANEIANKRTEIKFVLYSGSTVQKSLFNCTIIENVYRMKIKKLTIAIGVFCALIFTVFTSLKPIESSYDYSAEKNTKFGNDSLKLTKVNGISWDDFQPVSGQIERLGPNQIKAKLGKAPLILMLSSDKLAQLSTDNWMSFMRECDGTSALGISLLFWSKNNTGQRPDLTIAEGIFPGVPSRRAIPMKLLSEGRGTPKTPGSLISFAFGAGLHLDEWSRFAISVNDFYGSENRTVTLSDFQFTEQEPDYPVGNQIVVDEIGQWKQASFKDKFTDASKMIEYLQAEASLDIPERETDKLSHFGGIKEKQFEATGFFRTQRDSDRWFLVDPEGYAFYSMGIDIIGQGIGGNVEGIKALHEWLPSEADAKYSDSWTKADYIQDIRSETGFSTRNLFDFGVANLTKAFGEEWHENWSKITARRLIEWNVNTVGNWSDQVFAQKSKTPYVRNMESFPTTEKRIFRDFPDVFSTEYQERCNEFAMQLASSKDDPYLIGYFMNNEPGWAYIPELNLAERLLVQEDGFASKDTLITFLSEKYNMDIVAFNKAWSSEYADFKELNQPIRRAAELSEQANTDLKEFSKLMLEEYIRVPAFAAKKIDSKHLNLGIRWASSALKQKWRFAGSKYLDVFSMNNYTDDPTERLDIAAEMSGDMPVLIGEFHHGAMEGGHPTYGARWTKTEADRAIAYRYYAERAASHPNSIGIHYFAFHDDPVLGRFDGESFHQGFVTMTHRPYTDFVQGYQKANDGLYEVLLNKRKHVEKYPDGLVKFIPMSF